uniref:Ymf69 n=1 Tax=Tetrahymena rostrata TaxID=5909 RepID=A0A6G5NKW0_TETRO|nr:Ymf69 [Tetrahymena rostrata]QBI37935.1 Ymf69 [Tetrahymena rostrata]URP31125.1 Ymf69 [Tetrahymena rostrata]
MLQKIFLYDINNIKNNFIKNKNKFKNLFKKYQPLRLYVYLSNIYYLFIMETYIINLNNNNSFFYKYNWNFI